VAKYPGLLTRDPCPDRSTHPCWTYLSSDGKTANPRVSVDMRPRATHRRTGDHLRTDLIADALSNAVAARVPAPGVIFRSDRGCQSGQYTSAAFADLASEFAVTLSHGRTGQCWDNALSESFFASLKGELIDLQTWPTRAIARRAVVEYIGWYNGARLHSTLGYRSPAEN
jgi:transposase InsO family protein